MVATIALFYCIGLFELPWVTYPLSGFRYDLRSGFSLQNAAAFSRALDKEPGKLLVFVRYGPHHYVHSEWVYNEPDIDRSRIVWARAMPDGKDEELLRYYPKRQAWILDDDERVTLRPFGSAPHGKDEEILRYYPEKRAWIFDNEKTLPHSDSVLGKCR